jgi:hypothetical protein
VSLPTAEAKAAQKIIPSTKNETLNLTQKLSAEYKL